jgi:uncharacterized protein (DUF58 family)
MQLPKPVIARVTGRNRLLLALMIVLAALALLDDYQGWRFLLLGLGGAWWLSYAWARSLAERLRLQREMRFGWAQVGDQLEERFSLSNSGQFPGLWVEVVDHSNIPGYQASAVTGIDAGSRNQWRTHGVCSQRGLFTLGPTSLHASDPLGLYQVEIHDPRSTTLMITPPIVPLPEIRVAPGGRAGEGKPLPNAPERTVSAASVRQYSPGDSLRDVHWRTSARRDQFYVRLFESTPSGDWWILLDLEAGSQYGQGDHSTAEHGVILAASLADRGLRLGRAVGLAAQSGGEHPFLAFLPPRQGDVQRWEILRSLALVQPCQRSLRELLNGLRPTLGRYTSLVIITANVQGEWLDSLLALRWLGATPTVLLLDPYAFAGGPSAQPLGRQLNEWGIYHQVITPDLLDRPEARPGHKGQWQWRISPSGRAIAVNPSGETSWRPLQ